MIYNKLIAIGYKIKAEHKNIIKNSLNILEKEYFFYSIPEYDINDILNLNSPTIVISFGETVLKLINNKLCNTNDLCYIVNLPSLSQLVKSQENAQYRKQAYEKLKDLKLFLDKNFKENDSKLEVNKDNLPKLNEDIINKQINNTTSSYVCNKGKLTIEIGKSKNGTVKSDIFLTTEEYLTIKSMFDLFEVEKVEIIRQSEEEQ